MTLDETFPEAELLLLLASSDISKDSGVLQHENQKTGDDDQNNDYESPFYILVFDLPEHTAAGPSQAFPAKMAQ